MSNIRVEINPVTNYIFHMLSVAEVGYSNDYGRRWRHTVPETELAMLRKHAQQLTVKGGEHCGEWYGLLVCEAARGLVSPEEYYASVVDPAMAEVCRVMGGHYQDYLQQVYPEALREMQPYAEALQKLLDESDIAARAEALVGSSLEQFRVMLVNSVDKGPEGIDIAPDQDVFGIGRTPGEEMLFIAHEYIIYLLKQVLAGTAAFCAMETWPLTEGLAEYYLMQLQGHGGLLRRLEKEIAFYRSLPAGLDAREMFLRASAWELLRLIAREYREILGDNMTGVYVHGSMAFGCFSWKTGDIDFLVVTREEPDDHQKQRMLELLLQLDQFAPAKGFEMSVVRETDCLRPVHPIPFSLHFSNAHRASCRADMSAYIARMKGVDPDLAAHFTVTRAAGKVILGKPVDEVFGVVPREAYRASILYDVESAVEDVKENPVYVILNLCRVLAQLREGLVLSKEQGGLWGMEHLPAAHHRVIGAALASYRDGRPFAEDGVAFAAWAAENLR